MRRFFSLALLAFFSLFFQQNSFCQIGIGNTNPDPSAILDITSTNQGILAPRMTTLQRNTITSPADGLLVFDTDEGVFYFYETATGWLPLESAPVRDNYKLIKSAADLADELTAGGGSTYLLDENTYYEINGTIVLGAPIDLNDAYVSGLDANEDILFSVGGTIFSGAKGGSIRNVTLSASGGTIFNLTGTGTETLIFQNSIVANSSSVGTIESFNIVFMNIIQLVGNADGIEFEDINSLLLSNVAWFGNNTGTFETYTGTFALIEKVSGFCTVPASATAIDVSSNPSVSKGVISSTTFSGAGTYVNRYTVGSYTDYNFTNDWNIDCPGLPSESDASAIGYYYLNEGNTTTTTFVTDDVPVKVAGNTTANGLFRMSSTNNSLLYEGKEAREFQVICTGALDHNTTATPNARVYEFFLYKTPSGGSPTPVPGVSSERRFSNNDVGNFSMVGLVNLNPGDAIEIYVSVEDSNTSVNRAASVSTYFTRLNVVIK